VKAKILIYLGIATLFGCAHKPAPTPSSGYVGKPYEERFDPWRASNRALEPASKGDRDAQDVFFLAAYVRLSQPYMGGEDLEQMHGNCGQLLSALGDDGFSTALLRQRPEVRSAAIWFLDMSDVRRAYPKTYQILQAAPKIDWATNKAYRDS